MSIGSNIVEQLLLARCIESLVRGRAFESTGQGRIVFVGRGMRWMGGGSVEWIEVVVVADLRLRRNVVGGCRREIYFVGRVELQFVGEAELPDGLFGSCAENCKDSVFVGELHFCFCGVNVDIDTSGIDIKHYEIGRVVVVWNEVGVGLFDGGTESGVLDEASVDEEVLLAASLLSVFGFADVAFDADHVGFFFDGIKTLFVGVAEEL